MDEWILIESFFIKFDRISKNTFDSLTWGKFIFRALSGDILPLDTDALRSSLKEEKYRSLSSTDYTLTIEERRAPINRSTRRKTPVTGADSESSGRDKKTSARR